MRRVVALAVGLLCGAELVAVALIGGAGASVLVGWEGLLVAAALGFVALEASGRRRRGVDAAG